MLKLWTVGNNIRIAPYYHSHKLNIIGRTDVHQCHKEVIQKKCEKKIWGIRSLNSFWLWFTIELASLMADSLSTILTYLFKKDNIKAGNHSSLVSADKTLSKKLHSFSTNDGFELCLSKETINHSHSSTQNWKRERKPSRAFSLVRTVIGRGAWRLTWND